MSLPTIPGAVPDLTLENSLCQILSSVAMEELGLSHVINAEGEKLQYIVGTLPGRPGPGPTVDELLTVNESVRDTLSAVSMNQLYLTGKMNAALGVYSKYQSGGSGGSVTPGSVNITSDRGTVLGNYLYLPQGATATLRAQVSGGVTWTYGNQPGFTVTVQGGNAVVQTTANSAIGSTLTVTATSVSDAGKSDTKTIIIIDPAAVGVVVGGDGKLYADYGDNTFKAMNPDGTTGGNFICGGLDRRPGTADDRTDVFVASDGSKYLGPNADGSYQKPGPDRLLGTQDDVFVWKADPSKPMAPDNETTTPPAAVVTVTNIVVSPAAVTVFKGAEQDFTAIVYLSDGSTETTGILWNVSPPGHAGIDTNGKLTVLPNATAKTVTVHATSTRNPNIQGTATVDLIDQSDIGTEIPGLRTTAVGGTITIDGIDWVKVKDGQVTDVADRTDFSLLILKDVIAGSDGSYADTFDDLVDYRETNVRSKINGWYANTNMPTLKKFALQPQLLKSPNPSVYTGQPGMGMETAFCPMRRDLDNDLSSSQLENGTRWWTQTTTTSGESEGFLEILSYSGSWVPQHYSTKTISARPCVYVKR